jgi:glycosyltransferase involved in cell wall biosynthesis
VNVALVTSLERGGPIEHAVALAGALVARGVGVRAICANTELADRFAAAGAQPVLVALRGPWDLPRALRMRRALRGVDVVHAQDRRAGLWTRVLPRPGHAALVYTVHGLPDPYLPAPAGPGRPGLRALVAYRGLDALLARRADAVVTPSEAMADALVARVGYARGRLTVVPNGISVPSSPIARGEAVGTLSVLEPVKGLDVFVEAAALLAPGRPALAFAVFGEGTLDAELRERARRLGMDGCITFFGHVPADQALERLAVLALPSFMENAPLALLEAMAAGVPVVASRVGGIPETAPEGTALLVEPGDPAALAEAIARLLDDPELASRQSAAARAYVQRERSEAEMVRRLLEVYERVRRPA